MARRRKCSILSPPSYVSEASNHMNNLALKQSRTDKRRGYYLPGAYEDAKYTVLKGTGVNETHFKFTALCTGCASWTDFDGNPYILNGAGDTNFAYAYSATPVEEPTNPDTGFSIHDNVGRWIHDLGGARSDKFKEWVTTNTIA